MKTLKYTLLLGLLSLGFAPSRAQDISAILQERSRADKLPVSDTAILYQGTTITIHSDGRMDREEHIVRYLRNDNSWDDYGDPHLAYDADRQDLQVLVSRTHTVDGRKIDTTPNGFNPMVPFGLDLAPDFTHYRQMVVTHLGIENDAITELHYVIRDKKPLYPWGWGEVLFGGNEPILDRKVEVRIPTGSKLFVKEENGAPKATPLRVRDGEDQTVYVWEMKDIPLRNLSEAGARPRQSLPRVTFSTCADWSTLADEIHRRFSVALAQPGALPQDLSALKKIANDQQRLDSVVTFLQDRIALKDYNDPGFLLNFRPVGQIYNTGYGDPADLAVLYAAALETLGFAPHAFLAVQDDQPLACMTGAVQYVLHAIVAGTDCWIYPNSGEIRYSPPERVTLANVYPEKGAADSQMTAPRQGEFRLDMGITFKEDKTAQGWIIVKESGALSGYAKARSKDAEALLEDWTSDLFASPEVKDARIVSMNPDAVEVKADLSFPAPEKLMDGLLRLDIPWKAGELDGFVPHGLALNYPSRDLPMYMDHTGSCELNLQVSYPDAWKLMLAPKTRSEQAGEIALQRNVIADIGCITLTEKVDFSKQAISPQSWNAWRKVLLAADQKSERLMVFGTEKEETKQAKKE